MIVRTAVVFAAALLSAGAFAQDIGRVTKVTLYPGSATVERAVRVGAGSGRVEMTGLPANFDVKTLRVEGDAGIQIGEVTVQDIGRSEALSSREADLEQKIQGLKDDKAALDVDAKTAELVRDYLASLSKPEAGDKPRPAVDPKSIPATLEAIRKGGADAYRTMLQTDIKKRELDKKIAALERDLARLRTGARDVRSLWVAYAAAKPGELRAAYAVSNAGWKPLYRAALDSNASSMDLERQAAVMQRTGEDWRGVTLRLSTGAPRATQIVDPQPWQLVIRPPMQPRSGVAMEAPAAPAMLAKANRADEEKAPIVAQFETAFTSEFEVPGKVDVAADGRQVTVSLASQTIPVKQRIRVVPRRGLDANVTAEAEQPEGVWIPGEVQLYRDGSYIGATYWNALAKERIVLPFGRDDRVVVKSERVKNRGGESGVFSKRGERQVADLYTITSRHKGPVELLVLEASPVAVSDQISVDAKFEPTPKLKEWENQRGVVGWEQPLQPGETANFTVDYTINYPRDANIPGLP
ncbi:MAG TPA: DUF4139 domain-containing protein [Burkholderiales bacterium]|jgi:uncharacterized protein (TIGR02231 family)|nr:DUF4139 domain-containing protein [Burkholderiales bacterium]